MPFSKDIPDVPTQKGRKTTWNIIIKMIKKVLNCYVWQILSVDKFVLKDVINILAVKVVCYDDVLQEEISRWVHRVTWIRKEILYLYIYTEYRLMVDIGTLYTQHTLLPKWLYEYKVGSVYLNLVTINFCGKSMFMKN